MGRSVQACECALQQGWCSCCAGACRFPCLLGRCLRCCLGLLHICDGVCLLGRRAYIGKQLCTVAHCRSSEANVHTMIRTACCP